MYERFGKTLSIALGTYEISPYEAVALNSMIVNGGQFIKPYGLRMVKDYDGNEVFNAEEDAKNYIMSKRDEYGTIIDPQAASITLNILQGVLKEGGTAYYAAKSHGINFPAAGKTGTSTDYNDAWFIGYTSDAVTAVWIGNKKGAISLGRGRTGGAISAPVWAQYAANIYKNSKPANFTFFDDGLVKQSICVDSGLVPREDNLCPNVAKDTLFYEGTEPGKYCDIHNPVSDEETKSENENVTE
jgi:penicillin-binding protein 1A